MHNDITSDIINHDPDLEDLDGVDYDSLIIHDARIVGVTQVRMEGMTLVPVKEADTDQTSSLKYVGYIYIRRECINPC